MQTRELTADERRDLDAAYAVYCKKANAAFDNVGRGMGAITLDCAWNEYRRFCNDRGIVDTLRGWRVQK